jgi:CheY-like chemotaxis protein
MFMHLFSHLSLRRFPVTAAPRRYCTSSLPGQLKREEATGAPVEMSVAPTVERTGSMSNGFTMHTIVLADDHAVVRQTLKRLLNQQADLHLVGESSNGLETLSLVKQFQPDLLVTDLMMPGMNGLEVTRRIRLSYPGTRIVVVSVNADEPYVTGAMRCGANAFVLKTSCGRHLLPAVRAVLAGESYLSPPLRESSL